MNAKRRHLAAELAVLALCLSCSPGKGAEAGKKGAGAAQEALASSLAPPGRLAAELRRASWAGDAGEVQRLIQAGADANAADSGGFTPLMLAAGQGNAEIVRALLRAGADADVARVDGVTALLDACAAGQPEALAALIASGADVNARTRDGAGAMYWAAGRGYTEVARLLARAGCRLEDPVDRAGRTPLMHATINGQAGTVAALLELGARADARDPSGKTALDYALAEGKTDIAGLLLKADIAE